MYKVMASPLVSAYSSTLELASMKPLSNPERATGEFAIAAALYERGAQLNGTMLIILFVGATLGPRMAELTLLKKQRTTPPDAATRAREALDAASRGYTPSRSTAPEPQPTVISPS